MVLEEKCKAGLSYIVLHRILIFNDSDKRNAFLTFYASNRHLQFHQHHKIGFLLDAHNDE